MEELQHMKFGEELMEQRPSSDADSHSPGQENSPPFVEPEGLLLCSRGPATLFCPEPHDSSPQHHNPPKIILILSSYLRLGIPSSNLPSQLCDQNCIWISHLFMRATCLAHKIPLDFITLIQLMTYTVEDRKL
jgi:hypothetical protein